MDSGSPARVRLMTSNLLNGRADARSFAEVLDRVSPDVVVTQEMAFDVARVLFDRYPHTALMPRLDHRGQGIASRHPGEFGAIHLPVRGGRWARLATQLGPVTVAGIHFVNPIDFPWWRSVAARGDQLEGLLEWAGGLAPGPFVLAGDFNASPAWPVYRRLADRWEDLGAAGARAVGRRPRPTWAWRPGWPRLLRIDHVLGEGLVATETRVEPVRGTDHAAVVVDLSLPNGTGQSIPNRSS
jgi:endonuclease/exonuclease/phosphatase family metal-dependent hydrolase